MLLPSSSATERDVTVDEIPGGVRLQFYERDSDMPFVAVDLRDADARFLMEALGRTFDAPRAEGCE